MSRRKAKRALESYARKPPRIVVDSLHRVPRFGAAGRDMAPLPPLLGALLRLTHIVARTELVRALNEHGFDDITQTEFSVFQYPGPDGMRPIDLADRCAMTKQAMNYVLARLEAGGYVERRGNSGGATRLVRLTRRGRQVFALLRTTMARIEQEWSAEIGAERLEQLRSALLQIAVSSGQLEPLEKAGKERTRTRVQDLPRRHSRPKA